MNIHTHLTDLLVTGGSHVSHAILLDRSCPSKHFWARARIGLRRGVRDRFSTVSATVHHTLNAVARVKSVIMLQHDHRSRSLSNVRIYYGARTVPLDAQRLIQFASDLDGDMVTSRDHVPVKTAMKKEQVRERERYRRKTRCSAPFTRKKVPTRPPTSRSRSKASSALCSTAVSPLHPLASGDSGRKNCV